MRTKKDCINLIKTYTMIYNDEKNLKDGSIELVMQFEPVKGGGVMNSKNFSTDLNNLSIKIDELSIKVDELSKSIKILTDIVTDLVIRVDKLEQKVDKLEQKVDKLEQTVTEHSAIFKRNGLK